MPNRKLVALLDLENQIEAVFPRDRLRIDPDLKIAVLAIELDNVRDVVVHEGMRERSAGPRLHGFLQILVLDLLVAFERNFVDRRTLDDRDNDTVAVPGNPHVSEKAGGVKALERRVERSGIHAAGVGVKMGADHRRIGVPIAGDRDQGIRRRCRFRAFKRTGRHHPEQNQA